MISGKFNPSSIQICKNVWPQYIFCSLRVVKHGGHISIEHAVKKTIGNIPGNEATIALNVSPGSKIIKVKGYRL